VGEQLPIAQQQAKQQEGGEAAAGISGAPLPPGQRILSREERVEYRDQDGNLLNEEQVKALEGKVEFKTRYETRTRVVDADGKEVPQPGQDGQRPNDGSPRDPANPIADPNASAGGASSAGVAPPHPDVEGAEKSTRGVPEGLVADEPLPKEADPSIEGIREKEDKMAKPASEGNEATKQ